MNRKLFTGLIILMGISIVGIITVQLIWMDNAIRVKNQLFDRGVSEALKQTCEQAENIRDIKVISDVSSTDKKDSIGYMRSYSSNYVTVTSDDSSTSSTNIRLVINTDSDGSIRFETKTQSGTSDPKDDFIILHSDGETTQIDSIYNLGVIMIDSLLNTVNDIDVDIVIPEFKKKVKHKTQRLKTIATQVANEFEAIEKVDFDLKNLNISFQQRLNEKNIPLEYEMGVLKDSMVYDQTPEAQKNLLQTSIYKASLFPNDIIDKNIKLAVYFPEKETFIYRSIGWLLISSLMLSFAVLLSFSLSIFFILKQKKISEMKSDFINNMTHEFKTPIATISVAADSISNEKVINEPDKIRYFTGMIKKENSRMNRQVEDILTIARLDKEDFEFTWELVNINDLAEDVIQSIILQVEKKGGKVESKLEALNPIITCDKNHCANVIYNLLDNAIKYTTETPEIEIETKNIKGGILLSVQDNGIGMSKAVQAKIYERFYRQTSGNIHNVKGFGLGLSYVKAVVIANKGNIAVKSEPGKGSRFEVFFPFVRE